jgi:hypothetical protein
MRKTTVTRSKGATTVALDSLAIWSVNTTKKGAVKSIREYVTTFGEIIPAEELNIPTLDLRTKQADRDTALNALRPEVRAFAYFVLKFANKRRGITPGIETLCQWYAELNGKQARNVRRYIPRLTEVGILAGDNLLGPLFQHTGGTARAHLGEAARASTIYSRMLHDRVDPADGPRRTVDPATLTEEMVLTSALWGATEARYWAWWKAAPDTAMALYAA